jgi:ATP-dependent protease ClpP protease subunit
MMKTKTFLIALLALVFGTAGAAPAPKKLKVNPDRLVRVEGEIDDTALEQAALIESMVLESKAPIYIELNSLGGNVVTGLVLANAIHNAAAKGVQVNCFVTDFAMSMAFFLYSECPNRYALKYSLLLFHNARTEMNGNFNQDQLLNAYESLRQIETPLIEEMIRATGMDRKIFLRNYAAETVWPAIGLLREAPFFLTIVEDYDGFKRLTPEEAAADD